MARVLIGTSGWHYDSWRGPFFQKGLPLKSQLQCQSVFVCRLNGVFYRTPTPEAVESWRFQTGKDFHVRMEGVEIHYPLETTVGKFVE
jgi:uncharacterized protein YecE (DUF72 family)